jgi:ribonuclease R
MGPSQMMDTETSAVRNMGRKERKDRKGGKRGKGAGKRSHATSADGSTYIGVLDITRSGMGYAIVEGLGNDILIRPSEFNRAFHGDTVRVRVNQENARSGRLTGSVAEVLRRKQSEYIGTLEATRDFAYFLPDSQKPMPDFFISPDSLGEAKDGDRVVVRLLEWKEGSRNPKAAVVSVLDRDDENDLAMKDILVQNGFPLVFSEEAVEESLRMPEGVMSGDLEGRRDMRDVLTFTIDPVDARDFDDALSIREIRKGVYEVGVHIADVAHYVRPGTALDKDAYERATSVYLPDRVLPMLPESISNVLCSLRPHEDKLTFSCVFQLNAKGEVQETWIGRTAIHSNHRFTYEEVQHTIDSGEGHYADTILLLNKMAQRFRKARFRNGAINFSSQEVRFRLDEKGRPLGVVIKESGPSHQLIEEFMLLANRAVAERVSSTRPGDEAVPFPYRIHDRPDEERLLPFIDFARNYGHQFDTRTPQSIASSFNAMLEAVQGRPEQHVLEQLGIRTMAKAIYSTGNIGHYGLGFKDYCHFTSPIRRYPDILVHRILEGVLGPEEVKPERKMEKYCRHCSERERAAMESERAGNKYKQVEYMRQHLGGEFDAVISGVASFGFWAETVEHKCEGLVSILSLQEYDDFRHVEQEYRLAGKRSGRTFRMGDKVRIRVVAANLAKRQLDYEWVLYPDAEPEKNGKTKKKKKG